MFQLGRNNHINQENFIVIESSEDEEYDASSSEMEYPQEEMRMQQRNEGPRQPLRLLNPPQLRTLGEGRIYYWSTLRISGYFREYQQGLRNAEAIVLQQHEVVEPDISSAVTTYQRSTFTMEEMESAQRTAAREALYEIHLQMERRLDKETLEKVQNVMKIPRSTQNRIREREAQHIPLTGHKRGRKKGTQMKVNRRTIVLIKHLVETNPTITQKEIKKQLETAREEREEQEVPEKLRIQKLGRASIGNIIKNIGYTLQRLTKQPVPRNSPLQMKKRVLWGQLFLNLVKEDPVFVFLDESGFSRSQSRNYGYGERGQSATVTVDKIRHVNNTAIVAMIIGYGMYVEVIKGPCDNDRFVEYCENLIQHMKGIIPLNKTCIVVMDNASIHRRNVHQTFWKHHIYLLKTIPYSPQTNGVELCFSQAKKVINDIMGSQSFFAGIYTQILEAKVNDEYRTRMLELQRRYAVVDDVDMMEMENYAEFNVNIIRYAEATEELDEWYREKLDEARTLPENFNPFEIELTDDVFHAMINYAFKQITVENIRHYYAHTIKVADSCVQGYPLSMSKKFYEEYTMADMDSLLIYLEFSDALN